MHIQVWEHRQEHIQATYKFGNTDKRAYKFRNSDKGTYKCTYIFWSTYKQGYVHLAVHFLALNHNSKELKKI